MSQSTFDALLHCSALQPWIGPPQLFVSLDKVRALEVALQKTLSLDELRRILNVSEEEVHLLITTEVLPLGDDVDTMHPGSSVSIWALLQCLEHCEGFPQSWIYSDSPRRKEIMQRIGSNVQGFRTYVLESFVGQ